MIEIEYNLLKHYIKVKGHSNSTVCTGVSALVGTLSVALEERQDQLTSYYNNDDGETWEISVTPDEGCETIIGVIFCTIAQGLKEIEKSYDGLKFIDKTFDK